MDTTDRPRIELGADEGHEPRITITAIDAGDMGTMDTNERPRRSAAPTSFRERDVLKELTQQRYAQAAATVVHGTHRSIGAAAAAFGLCNKHLSHYVDVAHRNLERGVLSAEGNDDKQKENLAPLHNGNSTAKERAQRRAEAISAGKKLVASGGSYRAAAATVSDQFGISISHPSLHSAVASGMTGVRRLGREPVIPEADELQLVDWIQAHRKAGWPVPKTACLVRMRGIVGDCLRDGRPLSTSITDRWFYRFCGRHNICSRAIVPMDTTREDWASATNIERHYDILSDVLEESGLALRNPDFNRDRMLDE